MKYALLGMPAVMLLAGCDLGGNVYAMPPQQVYDKLVAASVSWDGKGPFWKLDVSPSGDGNGTVRWNTAFGMTLCEANIAPEGTDKSRIMVYCGAGGEGAAAGMTQAMHRSAIIEHIDAVLDDRPYDQRKAQGETATTWPDDPRQADGSIGAAAGEALKMEQEIRRAGREMEAAQANAAAEAAQRTPGVNFKPGQPMINVSK